ncbi:lyase family protein [Streptomyces showdoensis]|uniref:lyase family protein n=1 Tax=Streptomyces showdoensis TaxID=68268 RepID=UPI0031EDE97D
MHPNEDVNSGSRTNDVYPTAIRIAAIGAGGRELLRAMACAPGRLRREGRPSSGRRGQMGRTQLQARCPMTLGQGVSTIVR